MDREGWQARQEILSIEVAEVRLQTGIVPMRLKSKNSYLIHLLDLSLQESKLRHT